jgi:fumarylpyruvate hydrolase
MPDYVIDPPLVASIPVAGGAFPVRRIFCVGHNYAEHMREMATIPTATSPFSSPSPPTPWYLLIRRLNRG